MDPNTSIDECVRWHEKRLRDIERDLRRIELERHARHRFIALLKLVLFLMGIVLLMYWGTKHNWWAA